MDKLKSADVFEGDGIGIPVAGGKVTLTLKKWGGESADRPQPTDARPTLSPSTTASHTAPNHTTILTAHHWGSLLLSNLTI